MMVNVLVRKNILTKLWVALALVQATESQESAQNKDQVLIGRESTTARLLKSRGYLAKDHYISVQNNEITLNLVQVTNPLINNGLSGLRDKDPVLFIHGVFVNANCFFLLNEGVEPKDFSAFDVNSMGVGELEELLDGEPGASSLVFTALNFGHEVWLLNRRNARDTYIVNLKGEDSVLSGEQLYWGYSLDEQAEFDLPAVIDCILISTKRDKLAIVGHSAGSAIALMAQMERPELANKISRSLLWAPALDLAYTAQFTLFPLALVVLPLGVRLSTPTIPEVAVPLITNIIDLVCNKLALGSLVCYPILDLFFGSGTGQWAFNELRPSNEYFDPISFHELVQLTQSVIYSTMHHFDYFDTTKNIAAYGQASPPEYDASKIISRTISFWVGNTDVLADLANLDLTESRLSVSVERYNLGGSGVRFNHLAFLLHRNISKILIIPSLKTLEST